MGKDNENNYSDNLDNESWRITDAWDNDSATMAGQPLLTAASVPYVSATVAWQSRQKQQQENERQARENQNAFFGIPRLNESEAAPAPYKTTQEMDKLTWGWSGRQLQKAGSGENDSGDFNPALTAMQKLEEENRQIPKNRKMPVSAPFKPEPLLMMVGEATNSHQPENTELTQQAQYTEALTYGGLSASDHAAWVDDVSKTPV